MIPLAVLRLLSYRLAKTDLTQGSALRVGMSQPQLLFPMMQIRKIAASA
jgi:hypothetical protein